MLKSIPKRIPLNVFSVPNLSAFSKLGFNFNNLKLYDPVEVNIGSQSICSHLMSSDNSQNNANKSIPPDAPPNDSGANNPPENNSNNKNKAKTFSVSLKTVSMTHGKVELTESEKKFPVKTYLLFSSNHPQLPYVNQIANIKTGHLLKSHLDYPMAHFLENGKGEIYTVGVIFHHSVQRILKKTVRKSKDDPISITLNDKAQQYELKIKENFYRIKLVEVIKEDNCYFVKAIPYEDEKNVQFNEAIISNELKSIKILCDGIQKLAGFEKNYVFSKTEEFEIPNKSIDKKQIDKIIYKILKEIMILSPYFDNNIRLAVQAILERRSVIERLVMLKKYLEQHLDILNIVNRSIFEGDEILIKDYTQTRARLAIEYIKNNYLSSFGKLKADGSSSKGSTFQGNKSGTPDGGNMSDYYQKLSLIPDKVSKEKVKKEIERFEKLDKYSGEYSKIMTYLDEVFSLPWGKYADDIWDEIYAKKILDEKLFGLAKVKERIIEMISVNKLKYAQKIGDNKGFVILLSGPPGTGKTSIAKAIAESLQKDYRFISFAGVSDPHFVKGHKRTYVDSQPGIFVKELIKSRVMNPVFILDEIDKLAKNIHGTDPYYSLMEILNPEENENFVDHYLEIKADFSRVIFILTANEVMNILEPLKNRIEIIDVSAYIEEEKLAIAKNYLVPKILKNNGLQNGTIIYDDNTLSSIIKGWCYYESGVRELQRCLDKISRKFAVQLLNMLKESKVDLIQNNQEEIPSLKEPTIDMISQTENIKPQKEEKNQKALVPNPQAIDILNQKKLIFDSTNQIQNDKILKQYLGLPVFEEEFENRKKKLSRIGVCNILTVSGFVGNVLTVECVYNLTSLEKKGQLLLSGNLKKVLEESVYIAKINAYRYIPLDLFSSLVEKNVHIHFMEGATQKDGPSAGTAICTAYLSLLLDKPIPSNLGMTGELSLNGDVHRIGGVQAKVIACKSLGVSTIILPAGNMGDWSELPELLKNGLTVHFVRKYDEIFDLIFNGKLEKSKEENLNIIQSILSP